VNPWLGEPGAKARQQPETLIEQRHDLLKRRRPATVRSWVEDERAAGAHHRAFIGLLELQERCVERT
jgi:hypothetical protein